MIIFPCPFCNSDKLDTVSVDSNDNAVHCRDCDCRGPLAVSKFEDARLGEAIRLWNERR